MAWGQLHLQQPSPFTSYVGEFHPLPTVKPIFKPPLWSVAPTPPWPIVKHGTDICHGTHITAVWSETKIHICHPLEYMLVFVKLHTELQISQWNKVTAKHFFKDILYPKQVKLSMMETECLRCVFEILFVWRLSLRQNWWKELIGSFRAFQRTLNGTISSIEARESFGASLYRAAFKLNIIRDIWEPPFLPKSFEPQIPFNLTTTRSRLK